MPAPSPDGCPEKATPATHRAMRALCCTAMLHLVHCLWRELAGQIRRLLHPPKRYSVPAMFTEGMSWAPHEVFRGRAGGHSLQPDDEKEGQTCRELCGAPTQKHTPVLKHTSVSLPPEIINENVFWCASRFNPKGAATFINENRNKRKQNMAVQPHKTPLVVQRASLSAGQHRLNTMAAQPAAQPSEAARPPLGLLGERAQQWCACEAPNWVLTRGYRLQFLSTPPKFNMVLQSRVQGEKACILQEKINSRRTKELSE